MKTSEFIKRVGELGYDVFDYGGCVELHRNSSVFAKVLKNKVNQLDTSYNVNVPDLLFDLCVEYANTPIEEREDEQRYYLYNPVRKSYFNYDVEEDAYCWHNSIGVYDLQTTFTEDEIKNHMFRDIMELLVKEKAI